MNSGTIAAFAATFESIVGASGSAVGTWITERHQDRGDLLRKKIVRREALYFDFIAERARLPVDALEHNINDPQKLIAFYALLSRIGLSSSSQVLETAEDVTNLTPEQIHSRAVSGEDPLKEFSNVCRIELESLQRQLCWVEDSLPIRRPQRND